MISISAVICTHNRAELLAVALESLCQQAAEPACYEIIVIDNASIDSTPAITRKFCALYPDQSIRYVYEPTVGLSHARNRGWRESQATYVAYFDDDCKVPNGWVSLAEQTIREETPTAFGGPYSAYYCSPKPKWYKDSYASWCPSNRRFTLDPLNRWEFLSGTNMVYKRKTLEALGGFSPNWGMVGKRIGYGEETDLQRRIKANDSDAVILYDPDLCVYHLVRPEVQKLPYIARQRFAAGVTVQQVEFLMQERKNPFPRLSYLRKWALRKAFMSICDMILDIGWKSWHRDPKMYPFAQNYIIEKPFQYLEELGRLYATYQHYREQSVDSLAR